MAALRWIGISLAVLVGGCVLVGLFLPSGYTIERHTSINVEPDMVHYLVGDLKQWPEWTPWFDIDPTIRTTYGGKTAGAGAHQSWNGKSGSGELTFIESDSQTGVVYDLAFNDGQFKSVGAIQYERMPGGTKVTWTMKGDLGGNIIYRYFGLMLDSSVGKDFSRGLARLKTVAETMPAPSLGAE